MNLGIRSLALGLLLSSALVACAGAATTSPSGTPSDVAPTAVASASGAATTESAGSKVSANSATDRELVAALTAAGVPSPDRWAREIQEYRPYDTSDLTLQKLQDNLAKYNPDPATLAAILSTLQP